jgi:hypothetical protein
MALAKLMIRRGLIAALALGFPALALAQTAGIGGTVLQGQANPSLAMGVASAPLSSSATVTWINNPPSQAQVCYGLTTGYGTCTTRDSSPVSSDSATISGLAPGVLYHYQINTIASGYPQGFSADQTFTTTGAVSAVYVDCNGVDTNNGLTTSTPVLTFTKATSVAASSGRSTIYIRGKSFSGGASCTYAPTSNTNSIGANSGLSWIGYPPDGRNAAIVAPKYNTMGCGACNNITIANLTLDGTNSPTSNALIQYENSGGVFTFNISILGNVFQNLGQNGLHIYNSNHIYINGNTFNNVGDVTLDDVIAYSITPGNDANYVDVNFNDNIFNGCTRFCFETQNQDTTGASLLGSHFDRNIFTNFDTAAYGALSVTGAGFPAGVTASSSNPGSTIWGNTIIHSAVPCSRTGSTGPVGIEIALLYTTAENNIVQNTCYLMQVGGCTGCAILNNTITVASGDNAFAADGGYNETEWVGTNTIIGSSTNSVTGCPGSGSPGYCNFGFNSYGAEPTVWSPSTAYVNPY